MSELHKFLFEGLPVRGVLVRLSDSWQELLARQNESGAYPEPVAELLGQMCAAALLMQANIKFNGALELQVLGDGPIQLAVAEVQPDFAFRATATVQGDIPHAAPLSQLINRHQQGRCAITLDPKGRLPGQQPYQGVVPLQGARGEHLERLSDALEHYMRQSEQLDTRLVLAANGQVAAGLLIQRLPTLGEANLSGQRAAQAREDAMDACEDYNRIALLAASLQPDELLGLDADAILHRLFWQEPLQRLEPVAGVVRPRFVCGCSRQRVATMLHGLGVAEVESILAEQGAVEVACQFCGAQYRFDPVDAARLFLSASSQPPASDGVQ